MFTYQLHDPTTLRLLDDEHRARLAAQWGRRSAGRGSAGHVPPSATGPVSAATVPAQAGAPDPVAVGVAPSGR
jgi:hypothetical protein